MTAACLHTTVVDMLFLSVHLLIASSPAKRSREKYSKIPAYQSFRASKFLFLIGSVADCVRCTSIRVRSRTARMVQLAYGHQQDPNANASKVGAGLLQHISCFSGGKIIK